MPPPTYDRIFKSKLVRVKDRNGKYGKSYLREYKHGVAWRAHLENMKIVREAWFNPDIPEARRFLHSNFKNNKKLQAEVKEYIKKKLDAEPSTLYRYHLHCNHSVMTMSWEIEDIYEYFKQMKADYLKKERKRGALINLEGPRTNEAPHVIHDDVVPPEPDNRLCLQDNGVGEGNIRLINSLKVGGIQHESTPQHSLRGECSVEMQPHWSVEEEQCEHVNEVTSAMQNHHAEDIENRNSDQGKSVTPPREVAEGSTCYDSTMEMQHSVQEDIVALAQCGRTEESVQEGMRKRRTGGKFIPEEAPRTRRKTKEDGRARCAQNESVEDVDLDSDIPSVDIGRFSEVSKKIIVKHVMGCENLVEVMKGISSFAKQIPGYNKANFAKRAFKERRLLELDFVLKWALQKRVVLRGVDVSGGTDMINVHSAMVGDK